MNRFRVWDHLNSCYLQELGQNYWHCPYGLHGEDEIIGEANLYGLSDYLDNLDFTVQQNTGLTDKNGVKIFEGDVVRFISLFHSEYNEGVWSVGKVIFKDCSYRISTPKGDSPQWDDGCHKWYSLENMVSHEIEVIGNAMQNPELLNL